MKDLSIIILSYNTCAITLNCIKSVSESVSKINAEIIVVDNASNDSSVAQIKKFNQDIIVIENKENFGFAKANNQGLEKAKGKYILFLNSDTLVEKLDFTELIKYMNDHEKVGGLTVKVNLTDGQIDPASHRGFPTIWRSFCYFSGLERHLGGYKIFSQIFGGYHLLNRDFNKIHEIDSPSGAFFLTRFDLLKKLNGFDEKFFMYGEDLDLAFRIKEVDYKIIYYPLFSITHLKYQSGLKTKDDTVKKRIKKHFYEAMKIFFQKHFSKLYPKFINNFIYFVIDMKAKSS